MKKETSVSNALPVRGSSLVPSLFDTPCDQTEIAGVLSRSFLTAHLLTGNAAQAELAVMQAIDSWHPEEEDYGVLFQRSLAAAVGMISHRSHDQESYLPNELREILPLLSTDRGLVVLRFLAGLSAQVCSETLHLDVTEVPELSGLAIRRFTFGDLGRSSPGHGPVGSHVPAGDS